MARQESKNFSIHCSTALFCTPLVFFFFYGREHGGAATRRNWLSDWIGDSLMSAFMPTYIFQLCSAMEQAQRGMHASRGRRAKFSGGRLLMYGEGRTSWKRVSLKLEGGYFSCLFACVHADERTSQVGWFCIVVCRLIYAKFARLRGEEGFFSLFVPFHHSCLHPHPTPRPAPSLFELRYADIFASNHIFLQCLYFFGFSHPLHSYIDTRERDDQMG